MAKKKVVDEDLEDGGVQQEETTKAKTNIKLEDVIVSASTLLSRKTAVISLSPVHDINLGGGIPEGTSVIFSGKKKIGKTVSSLTLAKNAINTPCELLPRGEKRKVIYYDVEGRLKPRDLKGIHGLDINDVQLIQSKPGKIWVAEDYIDMAEQAINLYPGAVHIIDSYSQLCSKGEMQSNVRDKYRADVPVLLAKFTRRISNVIPINQCIVVGITHIIANQNAKGPMSSPWTEASGEKVQYASDVKLRATYSQPWKVGEEQIGQYVNWHCEWSAISKPGAKYVSNLRYGYGLDSEAELVELAKDLGIVSEGTWMEFDGKKFQGKEKFRQGLVDDPAMYKALYDQIRNMMGM